MIHRRIIQSAVSYSNANESNGTTGISVNDLKNFMALQYVRGLHGRHIPRDFLWSKQSGIQNFKGTMPRSEFHYTNVYQNLYALTTNTVNAIKSVI